MSSQTLDLAKKLYSRLAAAHEQARSNLGRALPLAEKILFSHLAAWPRQKLERGKTHLALYPDRVAMQDATAQMALLQFIVTRRASVAVPSSIHCDHLISAKSGVDKDLGRACDENREVYDFLSSAALRYGIDFWRAGSGIIHQVVLEQYAFPGGMIIGTDSHTPNAGGLGMVAVGVGGADAVDVMAAQSLDLVYPKLVGVKLSGALSGWASAKDLILKLAGKLTVKGGTGKILEYFGPGVESISCTGKATITNMGAELGATTSLFPFDRRMAEYLRHTDRADVADLAEGAKAYLSADPECISDPSKYYDEVIEIDLSTLEPQWVGPHSPDLLTPVAQMAQVVSEKGYPQKISAALIGSCTNSSYEDISRAASVVRQARAAGVELKAPLYITPGSDQIYQTIARDGLLELFVGAGATVLANACGPCIGQWKREAKGPNSIVTSYNRNFKGRNDGSEQTLAFIGSPEMVTVLAFAGDLGFNPLKDQLTGSGGKTFKLELPQGSALPANGYVFSRNGLVTASSDEAKRRAISIAISPSSERLAFIEEFAAWDGEDLRELVVLLKAKGKCTTDHISQAGPWLKYRGHLPNISKNMFIGAINAFSGETGKGLNVISGEKSQPFPEIGRYYREKKQGWVVIGDENYGEGSSREHAAMSPRYFGCRAVIARSFARIHETNLIKQGVLPLTFASLADYDLVGESDRLSIVGLKNLSSTSQIKLVIKASDGSLKKEVSLKSSLTDEQISWFKAGSALNLLKPK